MKLSDPQVRATIGAVLVPVLWIVSASASACVITLHTPDGHHHFSVVVSSIHSINPVEERGWDHLAPGTHSIVMIDGKHRGVRETEQQVIDLRKTKCGYGLTPKDETLRQR